MNVTLTNQQRRLPMPRAAWQRLIQWIAQKALKRARPPLADIVLIIVDDDGIREINRRCFSKDTATDVIALTYTPIAGARTRLAEIFVNAERALKRTRGNSRRAARELALYVAHGLDHLAGGRDNTPVARTAMLRRENRWLREAEREGLLKNIA